MAKRNKENKNLEKENDMLRREIEKLKKDVRKYKKQSLSLRNRINDLEYHIRDTCEEEILEQLSDMRRNCPTQTESMVDIEEESGKYVLEPDIGEPEEIEVDKFDGDPQSTTYGQTIKVKVPNPKRRVVKFNLTDRIRG